MEKRYDEDRKLYGKGKPANKKLLYLSDLSRRLRHVLFYNNSATNLGQIYRIRRSPTILVMVYKITIRYRTQFDIEKRTVTTP